MPRYEITDDVLSSHHEGESVLVHLHSKRCFRLNATAAAVWRGLEEGLSREAIVDRLCARFEVDGATAAAEADRLLEELEAARLIRASEAAVDI
jgi:hypothetical protein